MAFSVLIVDDSPAMRSFIRRTIDLSGLELAACHEASNGEEALAALRQNWVDAVLTDINMPLMNGEEFVRRLEADELLRSIPVLVVSTDATEKRVRQMVSLGARGYLAKPFTPENLREEIEKVLGVSHG
jgi:two-component system chemotaxis response regulator CheY